MLSQPLVKHQEVLNYVAIRTKVNQKAIPVILPPLLPKVYSWIRENKAACDGPPFFLYRSIDAANELVAEVAVPVKEKVCTNGYVFAEILPAGRYASVVHTGHYRQLMQAHKELEHWLKVNGYRERRCVGSYGTLWGCRAEFYLNSPDEEPDERRWMTMVTILLEDE